MLEGLNLVSEFVQKLAGQEIVCNLVRELAKRSARGTLLIALVFVIRLAAGRMCGKYRCLLWMMVAASFLIPTSVHVEITVPYEIVQEISENKVAQWIEEGQQETGISNTGQTTQGKEPSDAVSFLWFLGIGVVLAVQIYCYCKTRIRLATAVRIGKGIYRTDQIDSPFLFGILRPRIYLPVAMDEETAVYAVRHEQMHLRRLDSQVKFLVFLLCAVYWWNPLVWAMYFALEADMERACDEAVLEQEGTAAAAYAQSILNVSVNRSRIGWGMTFASGNTKNRVKYILRFRRAGWLQRVVCLLFTVLIVVPSVLQLRAEEQSMELIWQEILSEKNPDFPEYMFLEDGDQFEICLVGTQILEDEEAFREKVAEMAQEMLEKCPAIEELHIVWNEPENAQLWPYDKQTIGYEMCFRHFDVDFREVTGTDGI